MGRLPLSGGDVERSETEGVGIIGPYGGSANLFRRAHTVRPYGVGADLVRRADEADSPCQGEMLSEAKQRGQGSSAPTEKQFLIPNS